MNKGNSAGRAARARRFTVCSTLLLLAGLVLSLQINAGGIKKNDQRLIIFADARGCPTGVELESEVDNCKGSQFASNCGKNGKDCVCMRPDKFISWEAQNESKFEIKLTGDDPFTENCKLKSANKKRVKCKIAVVEGDYMYDVVLKSCPDQVYDPKIVIRN